MLRVPYLTLPYLILSYLHLMLSTLFFFKKQPILTRSALRVFYSVPLCCVVLCHVLCYGFLDQIVLHS